MTASSPVDVAVNPNNTDQRYILWGNGRIDAIGGAVPITDNPQWYNRLDQPVGVALHIKDWSTGAGYVLDMQGGFQPIGGAPALGTGSTPQAVTGVPYITTHTRTYVDWSWDPSGTGQGYVLDVYGQLWPFGGASAPPRAGRRYTTPRAVALDMQWSPTKMGAQLDWNGRVYPEFGATGVGSLTEIQPTFSAFRDLVVTDWSNAAGLSGYTLTLHGSVRSFGVAPSAFGWTYNPAGDVARTLAVISPSDPLTLWEVWAGGQQFEWNASTAPTVTAGGSGTVSPATTVTDTTRPDLLWDYSDPQADSQTDVQVLVFTQAFAGGHDMSDPLQWTASALVARETVDRTARGLACPTDLPNGAYRLFVRAQDSSGLWSAWSTRNWTQNVPAPATPTGLTAVADPASRTVALTVSAATGGSADLVRFDASDDDEATWAPVIGASAVTLAASTTAVDRFLPLGVTRTYRAVAYATDPAVASAPSATAAASVPATDYLLTSVADPALGGVLRVQEPIEWIRPSAAGVFQGLGAQYATVVKDGNPVKSRRGTVTIFSDDADTWATIEQLATADSTMVYRDPRGRVIFCELVGDWPQSQLEGAGLRYLDTTSLPLVEVAPPQAG